MSDYENLVLDNKEEEKNGCGCDCSTDGCCDPEESEQNSSTDIKNIEKDITVTIDGKSINVNPEDKNIVDVASRAKIGIPAPCYLAKRKNGCCNACVIEVDGEQKYACSTTPKNGMNIVVNRDDLKSLRKERLLKYNEGIKTGNTVPCSSKG